MLESMSFAEVDVAAYCAAMDLDPSKQFVLLEEWTCW
jgi:hypothetical protein